MNNIRFDENGAVARSRRPVQQRRGGAITTFLIKKGIARNERTASLILLIAAIVLFATAYILWPTEVAENEPTVTPPEVDANGVMYSIE